MDALPQGTILRGEHPYKIIKKLGQGSFGITYLATMKTTISGKLGAIDTELKVAIKEFFMRDINGRAGTTVTCGSKGGIYEDYKKKFIREARNLGKLQHPFIVKVVEDFEANNTVYFVMEYISGGNLDDYINKRGKLSKSETTRIAKQIGDALSFMHWKRMLHLDLKPGNIMMREDDSPVLIDFGLSKQYDHDGNPESSTAVGGGTPGYAPLEQSSYRKGEGKDFPMTMDVYAFGAILYKMLTGERPPEASHILNEGFPYQKLQKSNVGDALISCIAKAMSPTKKERYQTVEEFINDIEEKEEAIIEKESEEEEEAEIVVVEEPSNEKKEEKSDNDEKKNNIIDDGWQADNDYEETSWVEKIPWKILGMLLGFAIVFGAYKIAFSNEKDNTTNIGTSGELAVEEGYSPVDSLATALNANDTIAFSNFLTEAKTKIEELASSDPAKAKEILEAVQIFLKDRGEEIKKFVGTNSALATLIENVNKTPGIQAFDVDDGTKDAAEDAKDAVSGTIKSGNDVVKRHNHRYVEPDGYYEDYPEEPVEKAMLVIEEAKGGVEEAKGGAEEANDKVGVAAPAYKGKAAVEKAKDWKPEEEKK